MFQCYALISLQYNKKTLAEKPFLKKIKVY